jgi:hypothetical protein
MREGTAGVAQLWGYGANGDWTVTVQEGGEIIFAVEKGPRLPA